MAWTVSPIRILVSPASPRGRTVSDDGPPDAQREILTRSPMPLTPVDNHDVDFSKSSLGRLGHAKEDIDALRDFL